MRDNVVGVLALDTVNPKKYFLSNTIFSKAAMILLKYWLICNCIMLSELLIKVYVFICMIKQVRTDSESKSVERTYSVTNTYVIGN